MPDLILPHIGDTVVIATHNAGKLREIAEILDDVGLKAQSGANFDLPEPEETGSTFEANAILKARSGAVHASGHMVLADDSGLEVDALDGDPGIYSARWAGEQKDFIAAMQRIHKELQQRGENPEGARARFVCVLALAKDGYEAVTFRGTVEGTLSFPARGDHGFGYDPIFVADGYDGKTFAQIPAEEKHRISHRACAFALLLDALKQAQQATEKHG